MAWPAVTALWDGDRKMLHLLAPAAAAATGVTRTLRSIPTRAQYAIRPAAAIFAFAPSQLLVVYVSRGCKFGFIGGGDLSMCRVSPARSSG